MKKLSKSVEQSTKESIINSIQRLKESAKIKKVEFISNPISELHFINCKYYNLMR